MTALSQNSTQERILVKTEIASKGVELVPEHILATHSACILCLKIDHGLWFGSYGLMVDVIKVTVYGQIEGPKLGLL